AAAAAPPTWTAPVLVTLCSLGGLAIGLLFAASIKLRQGYRAGGQLPAFILFLLLESPTLVYSGILLCTLAGAFLITSDATHIGNLLLWTVAGGALLGGIFGVLQNVRDRWTRLLLSLALAIALGGGLLYCFGYQGNVFGQEFKISPQIELASSAVFGLQILLGIPIFYLLTFAGHEEESEVEI